MSTPNTACMHANKPPYPTPSQPKMLPKCPNTTVRNAKTQPNPMIRPSALPPSQSTINPRTPTTTAPNSIPDTLAAPGAAALATTLVALAAAELAAPAAPVADADTADTTPDVLDAAEEVAPEVADADVMLAVDDGLAGLDDDALAVEVGIVDDVEAATAPPAAPNFSIPAVIVSGK